MATIGVLTLEMRLDNSHSLKEKRHVVQSLKERLRHKFNVAVAEIDCQDLWQRALQNFQNPGSSGNIDYLLQEGGAQPGTPTLYDPSNYKPYNPNSK